MPVVAVVAPAGYGKSTLLAQWSESDPRHFAWLSIDERDNDPSVLLCLHCLRARRGLLARRLM